MHCVFNRSLISAPQRSGCSPGGGGIAIITEASSVSMLCKNCSPSPLIGQ